METMENIHHLATVHIEIENQKPVHISKLGWLNPYVANFIVPSKYESSFEVKKNRPLLLSTKLLTFYSLKNGTCVYRVVHSVH